MVRALAKHPAIPKAAIENLLVGYDGLCPDLLSVLSENQAILPAVLEELSQVDDVYVQRLAARHPNTLATVLDRMLSINLPEMDELSPEHFEFIYSEKSKQSVIVLTCLAQNPRASTEILVKLASTAVRNVLRGDHYLEVWKALAVNPSLPNPQRMSLLIRLMDLLRGA